MPSLARLVRRAGTSLVLAAALVAQPLVASAHTGAPSAPVVHGGEGGWVQVAPRPLLAGLAASRFQAGEVRTVAVPSGCCAADRVALVRRPGRGRVGPPRHGGALGREPGALGVAGHLLRRGVVINPTLVRADDTGRITVRSSVAARLSVSVVGVIQGSGSAVGAGGTVVVAPSSLVDSATGQGGDVPAPGTTSSVPVTGLAGIPATGARAVWLSVQGRASRSGSVSFVDPWAACRALRPSRCRPPGQRARARAHRRRRDGHVRRARLGRGGPADDRRRVDRRHRDRWGRAAGCSRCGAARGPFDRHDERARIGLRAHAEGRRQGCADVGLGGAARCVGPRCGARRPAVVDRGTVRGSVLGRRGRRGGRGGSDDADAGRPPRRGRHRATDDLAGLPARPGDAARIRRRGGRQLARPAGAHARGDLARGGARAGPGPDARGLVVAGTVSDAGSGVRDVRASVDGETLGSAKTAPARTGRRPGRSPCRPSPARTASASSRRTGRVVPQPP